MSEFAIKTENLSKTYKSFFKRNTVEALKSLSLEVPLNCVYGFLGPNGAGKTTSIKLIMDLIKPSDGSAQLFGQPTDDISVKQRIGFLPDAPAFSPHLTTRKFLTICAKLLHIPWDQRSAKIDEVLETVSMTKYANQKLGGFSRGMVQRVGFAQAILNDPELLILDEPLVGLDPHGRQDLKNIILRLKDKGTTIFFCSHILSDVEKMCDRVGILANGELLNSGPIADLLAPTGQDIHLNADENELFMKMMEKATSSSKLDDGSCELLFDNKPETVEFLKDLSQSHPNAFSIRTKKESLEDYFFRMTEKPKTEQTSTSSQEQAGSS